MNNFTKYICAGLAIALLIIQAIMIWGLYGNFSGSLNELSNCTRKQGTRSDRPVHDNDCHELGYHCSPAFHPVPPEQKTE